MPIEFWCHHCLSKWKWRTLLLPLCCNIYMFYITFSGRVSSQSNLSTAGSLIQSILKEGETPKFSGEEQRLCCSIMCTAEYCMETSLQLEEKLKEKTDPSLSSQISLSAEQDLFHRSAQLFLLHSCWPIPPFPSHLSFTPSPSLNPFSYALTNYHSRWVTTSITRQKTKHLVPLITAF